MIFFLRLAKSITLYLASKPNYVPMIIQRLHLKLRLILHARERHHATPGAFKLADGFGQFWRGAARVCQDQVDLLDVIRRQDGKPGNFIQDFLIAHEIFSVQGEERLGEVGGCAGQAAHGIVNIALRGEIAGMEEGKFR